MAPCYADQPLRKGGGKRALTAQADEVTIGQWRHAQQEVTRGHTTIAGRIVHADFSV